jgi:hypothetical protein
VSTDVLDGTKPSDEQREMYGALLLGDEPANGWWLAWCPRCDGDQSPQRATAEVHFGLGRFKCTNLPSCHEGRQSVTLSTALAWIRGYESVSAMRDARKAERQQAVDAKQAERDKRAADRQIERDRKRIEAEHKRAERRSRRQNRFADAGKRVEALASRHPGIDRKLLPSKAQMAIWEVWFDIDTAPVLQSATEGWWQGWCPLHDQEHEGKPSAMFNFRYGSYKCLQAEPCHAPKKGMTLVNLARQMESARA